MKTLNVESFRQECEDICEEFVINCPELILSNVLRLLYDYDIPDPAELLDLITDICSNITLVIIKKKKRLLELNIDDSMVSAIIDGQGKTPGIFTNTKEIIIGLYLPTQNNYINTYPIEIFLNNILCSLSYYATLMCAYNIVETIDDDHINEFTNEFFKEDSLAILQRVLDLDLEQIEEYILNSLTSMAVDITPIKNDKKNIEIISGQNMFMSCPKLNDRELNFNYFLDEKTHGKFQFN